MSIESAAQERHRAREIRWIIRDKYGGEGGSRVAADLVRLERGEPLDYIIGWVPFLGCRIDLSLRPFIPRPETEYWVKAIIQEIRRAEQSRREPLKILDMFAGSGCIGIAALADTERAFVDFAEKEERCIRQIKINLLQNGIREDRSRLIQSDFFEKAGELYDWILANPPYVPDGRGKILPHSVTRYEPWGAIFSGSDGMGHIRRFLHDAKKFLRPQGKIVMEFDSSQGKEIEAILAKERYGAVFFRDQYGRPRWLKAGSLVNNGFSVSSPIPAFVRTGVIGDPGSG
jgi:HemK-like putative methylase